MNRIRSVGRCASALPGLFSAGLDPGATARKTRARYRTALVAATAGITLPLAAATAGITLPRAAAAPASAAAAGPGAAQPDMVTQWNQAMIAGLEAAAVPPPPAARIG